jgi:tetratricopeptide (TPR) repeat protein
MKRAAAGISFMLALFCGLAFAQGDARSVCLSPATPSDDAIIACSEAIQAEPLVSSLWFTRGNALYREGDFDGAIADFTEMLSLNPSGDARAYQARGSAWFSKREYDRAIADYDNAIRIRPQYIRSYYSRGLAWERKKQLDKALEDYTRFSELDPSSLDAQKAVARVTAALKKKLTDYPKATQAIGEQNRDTVFNVAQVEIQSSCYRASNPEDMLSRCDEAIRIDPKDAWAYVIRGVGWQKQGDFNRAIADFNRAIGLDPTSVRAYGERGLIWFSKRDYDRAIADFNEVIKLHPTDEWMHGFRCAAWYGKEDFDQAIADCDEAIRRNPTMVDAYNDRGMAWEKKGVHDRAIADYSEVIRLRPKKSEGYYNRALAYYNSGDFDHAFTDYSEVTRLNPKFGGVARAYISIGNIWFKKGDNDRAIASYSEAIRIDEKIALAYYNRGLAWQKKNENQRALSDFTRASEIDSSLKFVSRFGPFGPEQFANVNSDNQPTRLQEKLVIAQGRRLALVIGNNSYQRIPQLDKAVGDADAMAQALQKIGFTVTESKDLGFEETARVVAEFEQSISRSDTVFFHFSGHGVQIKGDNLLLPVDTPQPKDGQQSVIQKFGLSAESVIQSFNDRGASLVVAVLDACRDNPFASSGTRGIGGSRGLAAITPVEGTFVIYSAGVNQTALDRLGASDQSSMSVFTRVFSPLLQEPNLSLVELAKRSQVKVRELARTVGHEQTPAYYDQVVGNVGLVER